MTLRFKSKMVVSCCVLLLINTCLADTAQASQLDMAKRQRQLLQNQIASNKSTVRQQQQTADRAKKNLLLTQRSIRALTNEITLNTVHIQQVRSRLTRLDGNIKYGQAQLSRDKSRLQALFRADYEDGHVSYLAVLLSTTSFSDLLTRIQALYVFISSENQLLNQTLTLEKTLKAEQIAQRKGYIQLEHENESLSTLRQQKTFEENQAQFSWLSAARQISALSQHQRQLEQQLNLTQSQIQALEAEAKQQETVLQTRNSSSSVTVPALRYHNIPASRLYNFVRTKNSAFSQADIQTICAVAKAYDVNPALMLAITGEELDFVQNGTPNEPWKLENPFDVFGSWALYHTTLTQSASYAAEIIQVKLSTPPPGREDPIIWINDPKNHTGNGVYATNPGWAYGVRALYNEIETYLATP